MQTWQSSRRRSTDWPRPVERFEEPMIEDEEDAKRLDATVEIIVYALIGAGVVLGFVLAWGMGWFS